MVTVLNGFPLPVVERVTRPETGLQLRCTFAPRTAEIYKACQEANEDYQRARRFMTWGSRNEKPVDAQPREQRSSYAELVAKYGPTFGIGVETKSAIAKAQAPTLDHIVDAYAGSNTAERLMAPAGRRTGRAGYFVKEDQS